MNIKEQFLIEFIPLVDKFRCSDRNHLRYILNAITRFSSKYLMNQVTFSRKEMLNVFMLLDYKFKSNSGLSIEKAIECIELQENFWIDFHVGIDHKICGLMYSASVYTPNTIDAEKLESIQNLISKAEKFKKLHFKNI